VSKRDTPGPGPLIGLAAIAALVLGGLIFYVLRGPAPRYDRENPPKIGTQEPPPENEITYTAAVFKDGKLTSVKRTAPEGSDPVVLAVNDSLESIPAVQPEARLVSAEPDGKNLKLKFTSNFNQTYGTDDEKNVLDALMKAVSMNSKAETVTLETVNGEPIETLGSADLVGPQSIRDWIGG
jgi:hypothetical protein